MQDSLQPHPITKSLATAALGDLEPFLGKSLKDPLNELAERPSKKFRKRLVTMAYRMISGDEDLTAADLPHVERLGDLLESLHLGSLVIDDIQDGSTERRGGPALHLQIGTSRAICAGNWLYFRAMNNLRNLGLTPDLELRATRAFGDTMESAHYGQVLDLTVKASQVSLEDLPKISHQICLLKTGCLTSFAVYVGALLGRGTEEQINLMGEFGLKFGVFLQMCDDLGNAFASPSNSKRFEDFLQDKPSGLWSLAHRMDPDLLVSLRAASSPEKFDPHSLGFWLQKHDFYARARAMIEVDIAEAFAPLQNPKLFNQRAVERCFTVTQELLHAYR